MNNSKIAISSDTTCALDRNIAQKLGLFLLPLNVIVDGVEYHDGIDISVDELAKKMRANSDIKTSTPTPYEIEQYFNQIFALGYEKIIHFTISSHLSSMFTLFTTQCQEKYGDKVIVIDSLSVCSLMLSNVLTALEMCKRGASVEEIVATCKARASEGIIYFIPENLNALKKGGRVSPAVATIGNFIGLKPVLIFKDGKIEKDGTTRKVKQVLEEKVKLLKENYSSEKYDFIIVCFDTNPGLVDGLQQLVKEMIPEAKAYLSPLSINVCAHAGPGTIGIGVAPKIDGHLFLSDLAV